MSHDHTKASRGRASFLRHRHLFQPVSPAATAALLARRPATAGDGAG